MTIFEFSFQRIKSTDMVCAVISRHKRHKTDDPTTFFYHSYRGVIYSIPHIFLQKMSFLIVQLTTHSKYLLIPDRHNYQMEDQLFQIYIPVFLLNSKSIEILLCFFLITTNFLSQLLLLHLI